jgi:hypothetical protein
MSILKLPIYGKETEYQESDRTGASEELALPLAPPFVRAMSPESGLPALHPAGVFSSATARGM